MPKENMSPEEKLLALIKGQQKTKTPAQAAGDNQKPDSPAGDSAAEKPKTESKDYASEVFKTIFSKNKIFDPIFLKSMNRYMLIVFAVLLLYFLLDILTAKPYKKVEEAVSGISTSGPAVEIERPAKEIAATAKDYSFYSAAIAGKKIFSQAPSDEGQAEKIGVGGNISDTLGLVGIIPGDNPQAIIEDKKNQKTYYLTKGQSFDNYTISEIGEGKVVLEYDGKKIALFL